MSETIDLDALLDTAIAHHEAGQLDLAEAGYRRVLQHQPDEPDALNLLGVILQARGDLPGSVALIRHALYVAPAFPEALTNLARALRVLGQASDAAEAAAKAITLDPTLAEAHLQLGHARLDLGDNEAAIKALAQATELAPRSADAWLQRGVALLRLHQDEAAADALTVAQQLQPNRLEILVNLGLATANLGQLEAARTWREQVVEHSPQDAAAHAALAETHDRRGDPVAAVACCHRALTLAPGRLDLWLLLGKNLAASGRPVDAETAFRQALALQPASALARQCLIGIGQVTAGADERDALATTLRDVGAPVMERIAAGFCLGTILDRAQDQDAAFTAFETANGLIRAVQGRTGTGFDAEALRRDVDGAISRFRPDVFTATAGWGDPSDLPVFIVGLPHAGLSLVEQIVASHPAVSVAAASAAISQVVAALQPNQGPASPHDWERAAVRHAARQHLALLCQPGLGHSSTGAPSEAPAVNPDRAGSPPASAIGQESARDTPDSGTSPGIPSNSRCAIPNVSGHPQPALGATAVRITHAQPDTILLLGHIGVLFPNARVIVVNRDPRDACLSCTFQPFDEGVPWASDQVDLAIRAQEIARLMAHWRAVLPLRMLEVSYEALVADQEAETRRLIAFLGLDWDPACLAFHTNTPRVPSARSWQPRQPLSAASVGRWRRYRRHLTPLLAGLAGLVPTDDAPPAWDLLAADPAVALPIAVSHHRAGRLEFAEPIYRALLERNPDDPVALHLLGLVQVDRAQPADAVALISRSLQLRPDVAPALADLARAYRAAGDVAAAIDAARRAVALDPSLPDAHIQLGCALLAHQDADAAVPVLQAGVALAPQSLEAHAALGTALTRQEDHAAAADAWLEALALQPDNPSLLADYAQSLGYLERFDEALATYRRAEALAPADPVIQYGIAWALIRTGQAEAGAGVCRRALDLAPGWAGLWLMLANCEAASGQFSAAATSYRQALTLDPRMTDALAGLVAVGATLEEDAADAGARAILHDASRSLRDRSAAGFALGKACDRRGAYDDAFAAFAAANGLLRQEHAAHGFVFDRAAYRQSIDQLIAQVDRQSFVLTEGWGDASDLPVFIVGMPRSGTSLVEQIAASHPLVFGAGEQKEMVGILTTLGGDRGEQAPQRWDRAAVRREAAGYVQRLRTLGGAAQRVTDKMPDNVLCLGQIAVLFPRARIVVCRRDLRDVGLSCYFQYFQEATMMWADDLADIGFRAAQVERLLDHWRNVLSVPILEIQYESLVANLEQESRRLIDFLGLDWDPACLAFHATQRTVLTASHWQVRQPLYDSSVGRWRHYRRWIGPLLDELGGRLPEDRTGA